jgi:hypothetical protein
MSIRIVHVTAAELGPYQEQLRALEREIRYPIADGADFFRIDHGERYATFFERIGEAHFLLALDGDRLAGTFGGVAKFVEGRGKRVQALYGADYKIAPAYRGGRVSRQYIWTAFGRIWMPDVPPWRFLFAAAMRGSRGDVMRSARGITPQRLGRPSARLHVYFTPRDQLARLEPLGCPAVPDGGLDLSPDVLHDPPGIVTTAGCKDLRLDSTGQPWPLWHLPLGPRAWIPTLAHYLRRAGETIPVGATACFALDQRLVPQVDWLRARGIEPGAVCTVYTLRFPILSPPTKPWVHLATSEI